MCIVFYPVFDFFGEKVTIKKRKLNWELEIVEKKWDADLKGRIARGSCWRCPISIIK